MGKAGEDAAVAYLLKSRFTIIERNWRCRAGELDVISLDEAAGEREKCLVFVEVKSRLSGPLADQHLFDTLTHAKQRRLRMLSEIYLRARPGLQPGRHNSSGVRTVRIDVVGVILDDLAARMPVVKHLRGAV